MKQVLLKKGEVIVEEVPATIIKDTNTLAQASYCCTSTGTEIPGVTFFGYSVLQKEPSDSGYPIPL